MEAKRPNDERRRLKVGRSGRSTSSMVLEEVEDDTMMRREVDIMEEHGRLTVKWYAGGMRKILMGTRSPGPVPRAIGSQTHSHQQEQQEEAKPQFLRSSSTDTVIDRLVLDRTRADPPLSEVMASRGGVRRGGGGGSGGAASEAGLLDDHRAHLTLESITRPPLFPDFHWHSSGRQQGNHHWQTSSGGPIPVAVSSSSSAAAATADTGVASAPADTEAAATAHPDQTVSSAACARATSLSNPKRPTSVVNLINKHREILQALRESAQHLRVGAQDSAMDVPRWSYQKQFGQTRRRRCRRALPDVEVLASLGRLGSDPRHFPAELLPSHDPLPQQLLPQRKRQRQADWTGAVGQSKTSHSPRWEDLAHRETVTADVGDPDPLGAVSRANTKYEGRRAPTAAATHPERDEADEAEDPPPEEEEEDMEDYTKDYYESEGESDDGDGEATF